MLGSLSRWNQMSLNPIITIKIIDCWGIDFMGQFPLSSQYEYILLAVEYLSKWVEAIRIRQNDHQTIIKFLKEDILPRFRTLKVIISDQATHFCSKPFEPLMGKYGITHKVFTTSHP